MATIEIPMIGFSVAPDSSGDVFIEPLESAMTLSTAVLGNLQCMTMLAPTGTNIGFHGSFTIPQNYAGTPVCVIRGYLGEAANTLGFGIQQLAVAHSDPLDTVLEAEDVASNATWTGLVAEDAYEETITLTPGSAYVAGDIVNYFFFRDDGVDTQNGEFHLADLAFRYSDT